MRDPGVPLVCIETALPAKFAATIREALGREPARPPAYAGLEARPQRCHVLPADAARVKAFIAEHAGAPDARGRDPRIAMPAYALANLAAATSRAGLRLALFLPVSRLAFRIDLVAARCCCSSLSALIDVGARLGARRRRRAMFAWSAPGNEFFGAGVLLLIARAARARCCGSARSRSRCR